jgi:hypothetical protein
MSSIREEYNARVKEAMAKASAAYKEGDYETALEALEPFRGNKKVDFAIEKIEGILQQDEKPKRKSLPDEQKRLLYGLAFLGMCMCAFFGMLSSNNSPTPKVTPNSSNNSTNYADDYYTALDDVIVWTCAGYDCERVVVLPVGTRVSFIESLEGEASPTDGNTLWYHVRLSDDREGFINSRLLSEIRPTPAPTPIPPPVSRPSTNSDSSTNNTAQRPENCDEAVAMGLTAQQAAQWPHLDRDKDGVACYGD